MATQSQNIIYSDDTIWAIADAHDLALEELKTCIGEEEDFSHLKSALADPSLYTLLTGGNENERNIKI